MFLKHGLVDKQIEIFVQCLKKDVCSFAVDFVYFT